MMFRSSRASLLSRLAWLTALTIALLGAVAICGASHLTTASRGLPTAERPIPDRAVPAAVTIELGLAVVLLVIAGAAALSLRRRRRLVLAAAVVAAAAALMLVAGEGVVRPALDALIGDRRYLYATSMGPLEWALVSNTILLTESYRPSERLGAGTACTLIVVALIAPVALVFVAVRDDDEPLKVMCGALLAYAGVLSALGFAARLGADIRRQALLPMAPWMAAMASLLVPIALGSVGVGLVAARRKLAGVLALVATYAVLVALGVMAAGAVAYTWDCEVRMRELRHAPGVGPCYGGARWSAPSPFSWPAWRSG